MIGLSDRGDAWIRHGIGRATLCVLAVAAVACFGGSNNGETPPTGVFGVVGGGTSGSSGGNFQGTYRLLTAHGVITPAQIFYDSTTGAADTVFAATFDSSFISLNSDSSAREIDYLTMRDIRTDGDSNVNRTVSFGDTTGGTYHVSGTAVTLTRNDTVGGVHQVVTQFTDANNRLTGLITFTLFNTAGAFVVTDTATVVYQFTGPPLSDRRPAHEISRQAGVSAGVSAGAPLQLRAPPLSTARTNGVAAGSMTPARRPALSAGARRLPPPSLAHTRP